METFFKLIRRARIILWIFINKIFFGSIGKFSYIYKSTKIEGRAWIYLGNRTSISEFVWIMVNRDICQTASLNIASNVYIGRLLHLIVFNKVTIEDDVLIADKVYISDNAHEFSNPNLPIKDQKVKLLKPIVISQGCWIGENACIIGASVGRNSVVAANSVVLSDVPDYCVVAGSPAKIIKKYNFETASWERAAR